MLEAQYSVFFNPNPVNGVFWPPAQSKLSQKYYKASFKKSEKICNLIFHVLEASHAKKNIFLFIGFFTINIFMIM